MFAGLESERKSWNLLSIHAFSALAKETWQDILFPLLSLLEVPHCPPLNSLNFLF